MADNTSDLIQLKNLGASSINILRAIGVNSHEELAAMGSVEAFCRIKARGINVSKVMLYAMEGALLDIHWKELPNDVKRRLVDSVSQLEDNFSD